MTLQAVADAMRDLVQRGAIFGLVGSNLTIYAPLPVTYLTDLLVSSCRCEVEVLVRAHGPYFCGECQMRIAPETAPTEAGSGVMCFDCGDGKLSAARLVVMMSHQGILPQHVWGEN